MENSVPLVFMASLRHKKIFSNFVYNFLMGCNYDILRISRIEDRTCSFRVISTQISTGCERRRYKKQDLM